MFYMEQKKRREKRMSDTVMVAIISGVGTLIGSICGIIAASKMTNYRIEQLEKRVDKHNNLIERMYKVEERAKSNSHRLDELENK